MSSFFHDSAIIDASIAMPASENQPKPGLEPGSALSKLLDSAIANAARESTPEPETKPESASPSSMLNFVPKRKSSRSHVYSIEQLLDMRAAPGVSEFDTRRIPGPAFWAIKQRNDSGAKPGHGKKSRRNHHSSNPPDGLNWERKPAGFLKTSEIDGMSTEKISQLLGEHPDEAQPDWDNPGASGDTRLSMGNTVEDFERWKQEMRREERRKHGEDVSDEVHTSNEVDSFFSFAKPKEASSSVSSPSVKTSEAKSSRFSSFFGSNPPTQPAAEKLPQRPDPQRHDSSTSDSSSRFFRNEPSEPSPSIRQGPPPGIHPSQFPQNLSGNGMPTNGMPTNGMNPAANGMGHSNGQPQNLGPSAVRPGPPPGLQQGVPFFPNMAPPGPTNNDSFFLSLLSKRENNDSRKHDDETAKTQNGSQNGSKTNGQYYPYSAPMGMPGPAPGMPGPPPGMFPPGMYPPGMAPPGQFPGPNTNSAGTNSQGKAEMPPWMRYGPQAGQFPPGFAPPPGFDPQFQAK